MDLKGVSKVDLLRIVGDIGRNTTKTKTSLQISSSVARLMAYSRSGTTELTSKSSEIAQESSAKNDLTKC